MLVIRRQTYPNTIGAFMTFGIVSSVLKYKMSSTKTPEDEVLLEA